MAWISVHESVKGPKLRELCKALNCSPFEALGVLNFLWLWGLENADKEGNILSADEEDLNWYLHGVGGPKCKLCMDAVVKALFDTGWLDRTPQGICIHDWDTWQDQWYKAKERRESDTQRKREYRKNKKLSPSPYNPGDTQKEDGPAESPQDCPAGNEGTEDNKQPETPTEVKKPIYTPGFEKFWSVYPRKEDKGLGYKKYAARRKDGYSDEDLYQAAKAYAEKCERLHTEKRYIKHPRTFLGDALPFVEFIPKEKKPDASLTVPERTNPFADEEDRSDN